MTEIKAVIAVQNHGTSGSTLMQSLLDDHPEILSLPALYGHTLYHFWQNHADLPSKDLRTAFVKEYASWGDPSLVPDTLGLQEMGENRDQPTKIDMEVFEKHLIEFGWDKETTLTKRQYIHDIYIAYAKALGRNLDQASYLIVFPIHGHNQTIAQYLLEDFDHTYMLHTTRNPIQNMGSGAKHILKEPHFGNVYLLNANTRQVFLEDAVHVNQTGLKGFHNYFADSEKIESRAVRLEDLHKDSEPTMKAIAQWVNISWDPVLLKSTYDGKLWNNRPSSIRQSGLGSNTVAQKHTEIFNNFDRWRIQNAGSHLMHFYHYISQDELAPLWLRKYALPLLLILPFKVEWSYPHFMRAYPVKVSRGHWLLGMEDLPQKVMKRFLPGIYAKANANPTAKKIMEALFSLTKLLKYFVKAYAAIMSVMGMILGYIKTRISLLTVWYQSFKDNITEGYVPLLHYKDMPKSETPQQDNASAAA